MRRFSVLFLLYILQIVRVVVRNMCVPIPEVVHGSGRPAGRVGSGPVLK